MYQSHKPTLTNVDLAITIIHYYNKRQWRNFNDFNENLDFN